MEHKIKVNGANQEWSIRALVLVLTLTLCAPSMYSYAKAWWIQRRVEQIIQKCHDDFSGIFIENNLQYIEHDAPIDRMREWCKERKIEKTTDCVRQFYDVWMLECFQSFH